jgi:Mrp family chromosome partitioning ATPase
MIVLGVSDIISGQFGPKSRDVLEKQAVRLWIASTGITAGEVVAAFRDGELVRFQLKVWMKIAVAGGKGGTGKTLIATALSIALSGSGESVVCCDADDVSVVVKIPFNRKIAALMKMLIPDTGYR